MSDAFELMEPQEASALLKRVPLELREHGEALFQAGCIVDLEAIRPGTAYEATVKDGATRRVRLEYDLAGWSANCSCRQKSCAHIFAAVRALLSEYSTAAVRSLSAGATKPRKPALAPLKDGESASVARRLMVAHGRELTGNEHEFLRRLQKVYNRCRMARRITYGDMVELGWQLGGGMWQELEIWPSLPGNDYEFWLYAAYAAHQEGAELPEFMAPITDFSIIQPRLLRWRREQETKEWRQKLKSARASAYPPTASVIESSLRLVLEKEEAILERRGGPGGEGFQRLKATQVSKFDLDYIDGRIALDTQSELLWSFFSQILSLNTTKLDYFEDEAIGILRCILRATALVDLVVDQAGHPITRVKEPLRWQLQAPGTDEEPYRLQLVRADGTAVSSVRCILPGQPTYYLIDDSLFTGPAYPEGVITTEEEETLIPAEAIETAEGLAFLQSLEIPLPERVNDRVRRVQFRVSLECSLEALHAGSSREQCVIQVRADGEDGQREIWNGFQWVTERSPKLNRNDQDRIVLLDRNLMQQIPDLLAPLNLKPTGYPPQLAAKITKKFPEIFAAWLKTVPAEIRLELDDELASLAKADVAGQVRLEVVETEIDWFDLHVLLNVTDATLTPEEVRLLLNARGNYVRLQGKGWRRLQFDLTPDEDERLARLGLSARGLSAEPQRLHALQLADNAAHRFLPEPQVEQIQRRASEIKTRVVPALPAGVTAELRPYQLEGFHFLAYLAANRFGGILADDMGLGKTLQALAWLLWLREAVASETSSAATENPAQRPSLVVCPKSVMDNWHAEAGRFTPALRVKSWPASELNGFLPRLGEADLHVINYNQLRLLGESLAGTRWLAVILDEGQYIKNPSSQTAQVARSLRTAHRLVLSGTPIENRLLDLWSLMTFAMPGVLGSRAQFAALYDAKGDPFARRRLAARVRPFLLRRTKAQVATDLPDRIEEDLYCEIEGEQKALYRAELKRAQQMLLRIQTQKELAQQHFHFLTSMLRLRQICCHPRLVNAESNAPSAKLEALLEQLEPLMDEGQKVLVFSQFVELLQLLQPALRERQWPMFYLAGETENRGELVRQFQATEGPALFLISLKAGGFGLNLTAASYVVLFDPWWNPAVENQAIDRTHRIGQVNKVIAYRLLIKDSIEEKIRALQKRKQAVAEDVLGEAKFAQSLTLDDLKFLFAD